MTKENENPVTAKLVTAIRILDSERVVTISQIQGQVKWLRSATERGLSDLNDDTMWAHAAFYDVTMHATRVAGHMETFKEQNQAMQRLHALAEAAKVTWPSDVRVIAKVAL